MAVMPGEGGGLRLGGKIFCTGKERNQGGAFQSWSLMRGWGDIFDGDLRGRSSQKKGREEKGIAD